MRARPKLTLARTWVVVLYKSWLFVWLVQLVCGCLVIVYGFVVNIGCLVCICSGACMLSYELVL